jgi:hypothetical protein
VKGITDIFELAENQHVATAMTNSWNCRCCFMCKHGCPATFERQLFSCPCSGAWKRQFFLNIRWSLVDLRKNTIFPEVPRQWQWCDIVRQCATVEVGDKYG